MTELFNITHDAGNLDEYDSTVIDGGDLSAHVDAALGGSTSGLKCVIDDTTSIYGVKEQADPGTGKLRYRVYIDPNGLTMAANNKFVIVNHRSDVASAVTQLEYIYQTGYKLRLEINDDDGWADNDTTGVITDAMHYVEVNVVQASSAVASDGSVQWWVDGVDQGIVTGLDNYHNFAGMSGFRVGGAFGIDSGTSGTMYIDELEANDDGGEIGEVVAAKSSGNGMRMRMREVKQ